MGRVKNPFEKNLFAFHYTQILSTLWRMLMCFPRENQIIFLSGHNFIYFFVVALPNPVKSLIKNTDHLARELDFFLHK